MVGRYALGNRIARGGMGEVYLATQLGVGGFKKPVVVKLLLPHLAEDSDGVALFLQEAQLAARMKHPNVVEIYDVGVSDGRYYLAMELVKGVGMNNLISRLKQTSARVGADVLVYVGRRLCAALSHAHELCGEDGAPLDVVHRDVTPHNVLLGAGGEVKLTDFGIAKARDSGVKTKPGTLRGKGAFVSPEQIEQGRVDLRSDLYSAAMTLYQLATLKVPFQRESAHATMQAVLRDDIPPLSVERPELPPAFCAAVMRALSRRGDERFASAHDFGEALGPEPASPQTAAALAELVKAQCGDDIAELHEQTRSLVAMDATPSMGATGSTLEATGPRRLRRLAPAVSAIAMLIAVGTTAAWWVSAPAAVTPPPAPVEVAHVEPPPPPPDEPAPALPPEAAEPAPRARPAPAARSMGYLSVDARPWAQVTLGTKVIGQTPMDRVPVAPGEWALTLANPNTKKSVKKKVKVVAGKTVFVKEDLR